MTFATRAILVLAPVATVACATGRSDIDWSAFVRSEHPLAGAEERDERQLSGDERELADAARLEPILRLALARDPELLEARDRVHGQAAAVRAAGRLPDLEVKYEQWGVPLARPWALNEAQTLMLGVRQTFPAAGSLGAEASAAREGATVELASYRARQLDVVAQVRRAYDGYVRAAEEYRIHLEHVELAGRIIQLARSSFRAGRGSQQGVLSLGLELTRLHRDIAAIKQRRVSAGALLNALMGRAPDEPLGPPPPLEPRRVRPDVVALQRAAETRPEVVAAQHAAARSEAMLDAAERTASWPSFMVGVDYWYMPIATDTQHAYGAMLSMTLPWLNPEHRARAEAARWTSSADRYAIAATRNTIRYEVRNAYARYQAAQEAFEIVDHDLLPQARQSLEAAQSAYATGGGDAIVVLDSLRSYLQVRLDRVAGLIDVADSIADLDRSIGSDVELEPTQGGQP